jgi:xylulose-5-phosphate/fructose-6-phosphate phosphoketolase
VQGNFRLFCPDEINSNRLGAVFEVENRCFVGKTLPIDDHVSPSGRVFEVLSEHLCEGWLEGYLLTGRHGLFATYEAFGMIATSMMVQHAKWLEEADKLPWREPISSLNVLLTSTAWRNDHNGFSHQGPGLIDVMLSKRGTVARIYLPPTPTAFSRWPTTASGAATTSTSSSSTSSPNCSGSTWRRR